MQLCQRLVIVLLEIVQFGSMTWALIWWFKKTLEVKRWELQFIKIAGMPYVFAHLIAALFNPLPPLTYIV